jgi:hypothetical protein
MRGMSTAYESMSTAYEEYEYGLRGMSIVYEYSVLV